MKKASLLLELWLCIRPARSYRETSTIDSIRNQLQKELADLDLVRILQETGTDPVPVHIGAVQAPQIFQHVQRTRRIRIDAEVLA